MISRQQVVNLMQLTMVLATFRAVHLMKMDSFGNRKTDLIASSCPFAGGCPFPSTWYTGGNYDFQYCLPAPVWNATQDDRDQGGVDNYTHCYEKCEQDPSCSGVSYKNGGAQWCYFCTEGGSSFKYVNPEDFAAYGSSLNLALKPCPTNQFRDSKTVKCTTCKTCASDEYAFLACNETQDTVCQKCDVPHPDSHGTCTACTKDACSAMTCNADYFARGAACVVCKTCSSNQYQTAACSQNADTQCGGCSIRHAVQDGSCTACTAHACTKVSCAPQFYASGGRCVACRNCSSSSGHYQLTACGVASDTQCGSCNSQFPISSGTCTACTAAACSEVSCSDGHYTSGITCMSCSVCGSGQFEQTACSSTSNRQCASCRTQYPVSSGWCTACNSAACTEVSCASGSAAAGGASCASCSVQHSIASGTCTTCTSTACSAVTCDTGYYASGVACSACTDCSSSPGQFERSACGTTSDTRCGTCSQQHPITSGTCTACNLATCTGVSCNANYYAYGLTCRECTDCSSNPGQFEVTSCGVSSDSQCGSCSSELLVSSGTCTACTSTACTAVSCNDEFYADGAECRACTVCGVTSLGCSATPAAGSSCSYTGTACSSTSNTQCINYELQQVTGVYLTSYGYIYGGTVAATYQVQANNASACYAQVDNDFAYHQNGTCLDIGPNLCYKWAGSFLAAEGFLSYAEPLGFMACS